ncbi:hypothetical protein ILYODFUR_033449 [Ilyodon furcidens]|uniref:Uncharacterized protein n=1 Tax=Ilyodon furcidens TaxID=33524 RepID=A0ABV0T2B9_9TELE
MQKSCRRRCTALLCIRNTALLHLPPSPSDFILSPLQDIIIVIIYLLRTLDQQAFFSAPSMMQPRCRSACRSCWA